MLTFSIIQTILLPPSKPERLLEERVHNLFLQFGFVLSAGVDFKLRGHKGSYVAHACGI